MEHPPWRTENLNVERCAKEWAVFSEPKSSLTCSRENTPFWVKPGRHPNTSAELLRAFLRDLCHDTGPYLYREAEIEGFCLPADLTVLKTGGSDEVTKPLALLDDLNRQGTDVRGTCRPNKGALSAHDLYLELCKPRFVKRLKDFAALIPESPPIKTNEPEHDAERRLIYVTDVDKWSILAIVATASSRQAAYYKDFIYRHLVSKTLLAVQIPIGAKTYALEFHLPFYVYRQGPSPIRDQRQRADGKPLRSSWDLGFLDLTARHESPPSLRDCIYEAQLSCLTTSFEEQSYVTVCFVDTYYRGSEDRMESVEYYAEENTRVKRDPLTQGRLDATIPIWKPREHFLKILECRVDQVREEWHNVVFRVLELLRGYTHDYLLRTEDQSPDHTERFNRQVQRFNRTIRFLQQVISHLSKTIDAWDSFQRRDRYYFCGAESSEGRASSLLHTIEKHMSELRYLRREVEDQKLLIESIEREISQHLQQESNKIANLQQQSGEHMKLLTRIALIFTPITISSGLFSVDSETLPFQKSPQSYFLITFCLGVIMLLISTIMLNWEWHYTLRDWACGGGNSARYRGRWSRVFKRTSAARRRLLEFDRGIVLSDSDDLEMGMRAADVRR